jgi:multidrug transporter EmrE-like cation transporter
VDAEREEVNDKIMSMIGFALFLLIVAVAAVLIGLAYQVWTGGGLQ